LDTLLQKLKARIATRQTAWIWSRTTLYNFLTNKMNYTYSEKKSHYESIKEDVVIAEQRIKYIKQLKAYRDEGRAIYFQDETWVNKYMTPLKTWMDETRGGGAPKLPQGKGARSIICHIGSKDGFLEGARPIYRGEKALQDSEYHTEMNSEVFLDWMSKNVFGKIPNGSVIVLDRATYHMKLTEDSKPASSNFSKQELAEWLLKRKIRARKYKTIDDFMNLKKVELCALCNKNKPKPRYEVVELAKKSKVKVLFLPVSHPELNPIELVWSQLKDYIKKKNVNYSLKEVEKHAKDFFDTFDEAEWAKCVDHVKRIEEEYLDVADDIPVHM